PPFLDLHAAEWTEPNCYQIRPDARRFENWESYVAGRIGLGVAVDYALALGLPEIAQRVSTLAAQLRAALSERPGIRVCDKGETLCGIVTFVKLDEDCETVQRRLRSSAINISVSSLSSTRYDMQARGLKQICRASVHYYNTEAEIARFCAAL
ncbi:MAG TPA: aminotransferase class V-fold PLP-dependent enzyme, partial [Polyangiales bacterium]|nr:aminotransferase class V-fold PLP-dependent enzyme [Polyangiales bacterium]